MTYFCNSVRSAAAALLFLAPAAPAVASTDIVPEAESAAAPAVLSERAAAIRAEILERFQPDSEVDAFYAARGYEPVWLDAEGLPDPRAGVLVAAMKDAGSHALPASRYDGTGLEAALALLADDARRTPAAAAAVEAELTQRFMLYASDLHSGAVEPRSVSREIHVYPERPTATALMSGATGAGDFGTWLAGLAPQSEEYARLRARYSEFVGMAAAGVWSDPVPRGRTLRPGDRNARVVALRARLVALGDLAPEAAVPATGADTLAVAETVSTDADATELPAAADPELYDPALEAAVRAFQERHGLNVDAAVGPATLAALNASPMFRAQQIAVNLERMRWLNRDLGERHVRVNIAAFMADVIDNGQPIFTTRVVVGKATHDRRTPEFDDVMEMMVVNPSWNVPRSIATKEILPLLREDPGYLDAHNMSLSDGTDPYLVDWENVTPGDFGWRISQRPGSGNALGRVKFLFPNDFSVYMHDTPSRSLFARDVRAYSHGCVRVEKPLEFAYLLLEGQEEDPAAAFAAWRRSGRERWVELDRPLPVHITYRTAWVDENGIDQFRQDIYGRDELAIRKLREAGVALPGG